VLGVWAGSLELRNVSFEGSRMWFPFWHFVQPVTARRVACNDGSTAASYARSPR